MAKRKAKSGEAGWDDYATVEFQPVDFQGGTIADMRKIYEDRWNMVAMSAAVLQRDHLGCKNFVAAMDKLDDDGKTLERFIKDLRADQQYFEALAEGMRSAEKRLLAGAARHINEKEGANAWA